MEDKNLHDIKIDELDSPKKTPLKNILTLLALLFIILVISVVITRLILNTDEGKEIELNTSNTTLLTDTESNATKDSDAYNTPAVTVPAHSNTPTTANHATSTVHERNMTSKTKTPLRTYTPTKEVKEVKKVKEAEAVKTYKNPTVTTRTTVKKEYIDKVVVKRNTSSSTSKESVGSTVTKLVKGFYIKIGTYNNPKVSINEVKKTGLNYKLVKTENGLTRVYIGKFTTKAGANNYLNRAKEINQAAYIYEAK